MTDTPPSESAFSAFEGAARVPPSSAPGVLSFLQGLAGATVVIGPVTYAFVRVAVNHFYASFGVTPEEVGWDAATMLARFGFPLTVLALVAVYFLARALEDTLIRTGSMRGALTTGWGPMAMVVAVISIGLILIGFAQSRANRLRRGEALTATLDSLMPISAPCVHIFWIDVPDSVSASVPMAGSNHRLVLFGSSANMTVLYEASTNATLRVPAGKIILRSCDSRVSSK